MAATTANTNAIFAGKIINPAVKLDNAANLDWAILRVGSTDGDRIDNIIATSSDNADNGLVFAINDGTNDYLIGVVKLPAGAGFTSGVKGISVINQTNFPGLGDGSLYLQAGYTLKVHAMNQISLGAVVFLVGFGGEH